VNQTGTLIKALSSAPGSHGSDVVVSSTPLIIEPSVPKFIADGVMEGLDTPHDESAKNEEEFAGAALIHLRSRTSGALVHYTLTGKDPTESSPVYVRGHPIKLSKGGQVQIEAMTMVPGMSPSPVVTSDIFKILSCVIEPEIEPVSSCPYSGQVLVTLRPLSTGSQNLFHFGFLHTDKGI
jgi:hypothetical protein